MAGAVLTQLGCSVVILASWPLILARLEARGLPLERCTVGVAALNQYAGTGAETLGQLSGSSLYVQFGLPRLGGLVSVAPFVAACGLLAGRIGSVGAVAVGRQALL